MEEDIKILEEFIKYNKYFREEDGKLTITIDESLKSKLDVALKNFLKCYKELEEFKKQVTEIENTNFIKYKNYIQVSLVEEKIEELDKKINDIPDNEGNFAKAILIRTKITLQELLEKRK